MHNSSENSGMPAVAHEVAKVGDIARRTALSFFLFALVLTGLLSLSWFLLVPELTRVEVGGEVRDVVSLEQYQSEVQLKIRELENKRGAFLLPVHHNVYERIKHIKQERTQFQEFRAALRQVIKELVPDQSNVIIISSFQFDAKAHTAEIRGDVRNIGPRSMTVLARFVEALHAIDFVIDVETSRYSRKQDPVIGFYSPFTLYVRLDRV